ncbi:hypothetical protein BGX28_009268 [Mortierella sp. GBA30]|nr:hypothetical protein BGX28_009268 [Mortierella sp. GBA30]
MDTKRKVEESFALLNSLFAHPTKKQSTVKRHLTAATSLSPAIPVSSSPDTTSAARRRSFRPPRPAVLDKLSRLAASRPTLHDSIAASIAASAPTTQLVSSASTASAGSESDSTLAEKKVLDRKRYMPWSRDQFHERLETFKPSTWFDKPKMVNAVECAKRGWINTGDDRLECCGGCGGIVIVRVDLESDFLKKQDIAANATDSDKETSTDTNDNFDVDMDGLVSELDVEDNIYKFPVVSQSQARQEMLDRAESLESLASDPVVEKVHHPLSTKQVETLKSMFPDVPSTKSMIIEGEDDEEEDDSAFDVVQSHKWYCYWVNPESDQDRREGWTILYKSLTAASRAKENGDYSGSDPEGAVRWNQPSDAVAQIKRMLRGQIA